MAAAVFDLFPEASLLSGQGTSKCFYYDFQLPFKMNEELLRLMEERMRLLIREKRPLRQMEMLPANAAEFLRHKGQLIAAESLENAPSSLVELCCIGECPMPAPQSFTLTHELGVFKLIEAISISEGITRIIGIQAPDKEVLKRAVKDFLPSERRHQNFLQEQGLFLENAGEWIWLPRAECIREELYRFWRHEHEKQNFQLIASTGDVDKAHLAVLTHAAYLKTAEFFCRSASEEPAGCEGLLATESYFVDSAYLRCSDAKLLEEIISSLQFILKIPKILGFEFEIDLSISGTKKSKVAALMAEALRGLQLPFVERRGAPEGLKACVEVMLLDALGRKWRGPYLGALERVASSEQGYFLRRSTFGPLERWIALLLEKGAGELPFWLAPEQVRILLIGKEGAPWAAEVSRVLQALSVRVAVDSETSALKKRLYEAKRDRVPLVILVGEKEKKTKTLTLHQGNRQVTLEEVCVMIEGAKQSGNTELEN